MGFEFKWNFVYRSICWQMFLKISVLKSFTNFTEKHLRWSLILVNLQAWFAATLLKRDSNIDVFLWNLIHFWEQHLQWLLPRLSGRPMLYELNWYVETPALVFSCEFCEMFKNMIDHLRWLLLYVTRYKTSKYTMAAKCDELVVWWKV